MRHSPRRKLTIGERVFVWSLAGNSIYGPGERHIIVRIPGLPGRLLIDPYPWAFAIRPASVANAIKFALSQRWNPAKVAPPFVVSYEREAFIVLPPGVKFYHDLPDL